MGFSQVGESRGYSLDGAHRLLAASYCSGFSCYRTWTQEHRLNNCGTRAQLLHGMWDRPVPGIEFLLPVLAGGLPNIGPPGKSPISYIFTLT